MSTPHSLTLVARDEIGQEDQLRARLARSALEELPEPVRRVVELRLLRRPTMTLCEIAEFEDLPISVVRSRMTAGLRAIAAKLREREGASWR